MTKDIDIRRATLTDIDTLVRFNVDMAWETEQKQLDASTVFQGVKTLLEQPQYGFYVVAVIRQQVVGALLVTFEWSDWRCGQFWWIQSVYVEPAFRKQGVFRKLYESIKKETQTHVDICGLRLYAEQSNHTAEQTYQRLGMTKTGYEVYEERLEDKDTTKNRI